MNLQDIDVLFDEDEIDQKVKALGEQISHDYQGEKLLVLGILKGAFIFMADLVRQIRDVRLELDFISISSYGNSTMSSGEVRILKDLDSSVESKNILVVEDIIDSGLTLKYITDILAKRGAKSVKICCLLDKPSRRKSTVIPDYVGFSIPDEFVVGYGLDYAEKYRNYPAICILKPSVYKK